jgi:hypothetical protein
MRESENAARVKRIYEILFQRAPTSGETAAALRFVARSEAPESTAPPKPVSAEWQYGYGEFDTASGRVKSFTKLPHFTGDAWQGGAKWPDAKLGWVQLTADGGHAGNDLKHAAIRRWTAPRDGTFSISGTLAHDYEPGDGIRGRVVSSRTGQLGSWELHNQRAETKFDSVELKRGDTLDFLVDFRNNLNSDMFKWAPAIRTSDASASAAMISSWNAEKDFGGPPVARVASLTPWEKLAQVLLSSNEFLFVD